MKKFREITVAVVLAICAAMFVEYLWGHGRRSQADANGKGFKLTIEYEKK